MLREIMNKPTIQKLGYLEAPGHDFASDFKALEGVLSLQDDVLKEVHHFNYLQIPFYTYGPTFYYWNLGVSKWTY